MLDCEWRRGPHRCHDLFDSNNTLLGYTMPSHSGVRGYVITHNGPGLAKFSGMFDHADEASARSWVEDQARSALAQQAKGEGGGE